MSTNMLSPFTPHLLLLFTRTRKHMQFGVNNTLVCNNMCVCKHVYVCVCVRICMYVRVYLRVCFMVYVHTYVHACACVCSFELLCEHNMHACIYVRRTYFVVNYSFKTWSMLVYMSYICSHIRMYVRMYIHT